MFTGKLKKRHRLHFKPGVCSFSTKVFFENKTSASGQVWPSVCTKENDINRMHDTGISMLVKQSATLTVSRLKLFN